MKKQARRRATVTKLMRSETVTVRLDPKLRYLADLAARKQRRTLSSFIEGAIEDSLSQVYLVESQDSDTQQDRTVADEAEALWDVDEPDRFAKLALTYPDLLTHEEQKRWKLIRENGCLWKGAYAKRGGRWEWRTEEQNLVFERLREHWASFCAVARGEARPDILPTWNEFKPSDIP